jgi:hypothetical protein
MLLAASASVLPAEAAAQPDAAHARAVAEHWLDGLGRRGLVLNETMNHGGFEVSHSEGLQGLITRFQLRQPGWSLLIAFDGELSTTTPLRTLRNSFRYAALDRLPTPGLEIPGWEVWPRTPRSSFGEGVEILAYGNGRIRLRVRTSFFALYGRDPSVLVPADSRAPAGSFFQIRRSIPLDLTIDAAVTFL